MIKQYLLCTLVVLGCHSMYVSFSSKPVCFTIEDQPGKQVKFFYEVIGSDGIGHKVDFTPLSPGKYQPFTLNGAKGQTKFSDTSVKICFTSTQNNQKSASIQYYTHDTAHVMELALKSQVYDLHTKLIEVGEQIKEVNKNEMFEETRQSVFADVVAEQEGRIQKFAILKVLAIMAVAGAQLYLLKALLSKQGTGYQPV